LFQPGYVVVEAGRSTSQGDDTGRLGEQVKKGRCFHRAKFFFSASEEEVGNRFPVFFFEEQVKVDSGQIEIGGAPLGPIGFPGAHHAH
jgi:hypothetical protein